MKFKISAKEGFARRGELAFDRGAIQTPAFMPVGTNGTVKALEVDNIISGSFEEIKSLGINPKSPYSIVPTYL